MSNRIDRSKAEFVRWRDLPVFKSNDDGKMSDYVMFADLKDGRVINVALRTDKLNTTVLEEMYRAIAQKIIKEVTK